MSSIGRELDELAAKMDRTAKSATRLGVSVESLIQMQRAAEFAGVGARELEMAVQRMTRRVSEAAEGLGEAQGALEQLNLQARELNQLGPEQQFRAILRALDSIPNANDRLRTAFKIFDSEGTRVLQLLDDGYAGFQQKMQQAAETIPANMKQISDRVEKANDQITRSMQRLEAANLEAAASWRQLKAAMANTFAAATAGAAEQEKQMVRLNRIAVGFQNQAGKGPIQDFLRGGGPRLIGQPLVEARRQVDAAVDAAANALPKAMLQVENELGRRMFNLGVLVAEGMEQVVPRMDSAIKGLREQVEAVLVPVEEALEPLRTFDRPGAAVRGSLEAFQGVQQAQANQARNAERQRRRTNQLLEENNRLLRAANQMQPEGLNVNPFQLNRR